MPSHASNQHLQLGCPADLHNMPETSDRDAPAQTADEPQPVLPAADAREREATELAAVRRQYSRASSYRQTGQGIRSREAETPLGHVAYNIAKFWSRQVSITVPHESCRDHLGTVPSRSILSLGDLPSSSRLRNLHSETPYFTGELNNCPCSLVCKPYLSPPGLDIFKFIYRRGDGGGPHRVAFPL